MQINMADAQFRIKRHTAYREMSECLAEGYKGTIVRSIERYAAVANKPIGRVWRIVTLARRRGIRIMVERMAARRHRYERWLATRNEEERETVKYPFIDVSEAKGNRDRQKTRCEREEQQPTAKWQKLFEENAHWAEMYHTKIQRAQIRRLATRQHNAIEFETPCMESDARVSSKNREAWKGLAITEDNTAEGKATRPWTESEIKALASLK